VLNPNALAVTIETRLNPAVNTIDHAKNFILALQLCGEDLRFGFDDRLRLERIGW
jgi:hypothetical protein